jgi:hypothetical protein
MPQYIVFLYIMFHYCTVVDTLHYVYVYIYIFNNINVYYQSNKKVNVDLQTFFLWIKVTLIKTYLDFLI